MGIFYKDVDLSAVETPGQPSQLGRRGYNQEISTGNASMQGKGPDQVPPGGDKKPGDLKTRSTYKYKYGYAGENHSDKDGQINGPSSKGQEPKINAASYMAELDASINVPMTNNVTLFKRFEIDNDCTNDSTSLKQFVEMQLSSVIYYSLDFPEENVSTYNSITTIHLDKSKDYSRLLINTGDIIGKVITKSGIIYVLDDFPTNLLCRNNYLKCLNGDNENTVIQGCKDETVKNALKTLGTNIYLESIKQEISELGYSPGCVDLPLKNGGSGSSTVTIDETSSTKTLPESDLTCLFAKYNIENGNYGSEFINQRFSTNDDNYKKKKRHDSLISGQGSMGDSGEVNQPAAIKRESLTQNTNAYNLKKMSGGGDSNTQQIHEKMNF
ncbi:hypothetical protein AYI70_g6125 [Smittium culicis]|uniref:Uncharacterized protein n=1 Tax=Smittium culicis TaxID=133412 RepID=A0A1R1XRF0_9FUNG|nr:hypothetical protein AYI70_g6125 [Smittium culicis]